MTGNLEIRCPEMATRAAYRPTKHGGEILNVRPALDGFFVRDDASEVTVKVVRIHGLSITDQLAAPSAFEMGGKVTEFITIFPPTFVRVHLAPWVWMVDSCEGKSIEDITIRMVSRLPQEPCTVDILDIFDGLTMRVHAIRAPTTVTLLDGRQDTADVVYPECLAPQVGHGVFMVPPVECVGKFLF